MAQTFKLPDLGEGIHEAEIQEVLVSPGDQVEEDQTILVVETDKAAVEVPSPVAGVVGQVFVKAGDLVEVGTELLAFGEAEDQAENAAPPAETEKPGGREAKPAPGQEAQPAQEHGSQAPQRARPSNGPVPASPATRRLARELEVDLADVPASGPEGLVTAEDVRSFAEEGAQRPETARAEAPPEEESARARSAGRPRQAAAVRPDLVAPPPLPDFARLGPVERVPLRSVRRATARQMALAWSQVPHVTHHELVDITALDEFRQQQKEEVEERGGSLTLTIFTMKAAVAALKAHPRFNASLDAGAEEIVLKRYYNLGIAVDTDRGLIVPVIRDVDRKSITELALELTELAERTRKGEATPDDLQGSTFTITNIGAIGGTSFEPIVNYPDAAILGMARATWQPVVRVSPYGKKEIVARLMLPLVLAFDHRIADGADAARFMRTLMEALVDPNKMLLVL